MNKAVRLGLAGLMAAAILGGTSAAFANDDIIKEGACSLASDWQLKVGTEDNGLDGEWEVDSNVVGQTWNYKVKQNGTVIAQGQATTQAPSGSFEIDFAGPNNPGSDRFVAQAKNPATGESCRGTLTF